MWSSKLDNFFSHVMSSVQLLEHSMRRLYPWIIHAPVLLGTGVRLAGSIMFTPGLITM